MKPFLTVYGHVCVDQIITVDEFPKENTSVNITSEVSRLGGTAANVAVVAASLGVPTALSAFIGLDFPPNQEEFIRSKGINLDEFVKVDDTSSKAIVINDSKLSQKVLFYQGPQGRASALDMMRTKNAEMSAYTHFCTGEPKYSIDVMKNIKGKTKIVFDPAQEIHALWNEDNFGEAMQYADILFSNQFEAVSMLKYLGRKTFDGIDFPLVFTTKGKDGCDVFNKGMKKSYPIIKAKKTVDATGAGDAFRGGFYAAMYHRMSFDDAMTIAATTSSFIVESVGATTSVPTWDMVMERADGFLKG